MRKLVLGLAVIASIAFISCKTQESAYKKAYEKAKAQEQTQVTTTVPTTPVVTVTTPTTQVDEYDNTNNNTNNYNNYTYNNNTNDDQYSTANVKRYCVVVGSFESLSGAEQRRQSVVNNGYGSAKIIRGGLGYRVVATSFNDIDSAKSSRNTLIKMYDGAWILDTQK